MLQSWQPLLQKQLDMMLDSRLCKPQRYGNTIMSLLRSLIVEIGFRLILLYRAVQSIHRLRTCRK